MLIRMNRAHFPVTVLGPGRRIGLWLQGCSLACKGCVSRDTWDVEGRPLTDLDQVMDWVASVGADADGVTISGGEPFQQPEALDELLRRLDVWRRGQGRGIDLLSYSGYTLPWLRRRHPEILARLDAVIPAPFVEKRPTNLVWRGSANQALIPLSPLGRRRFGESIDKAEIEPGMQVSVEGDTLWMIGIPREGVMPALEEALKARGIVHGGVSWR
ncbi:MAG: 4Fe-4S single cluster domain-containing protein [Caulobacter sp.]